MGHLEGNSKTGIVAPATYLFGWQKLRSRLGNMGDADRLALSDCAEGQGGRAARVSTLLMLAYDLPGQVFEPERLSLVDRVAALFAVAHSFGNWPARFVCQCVACSSANELRVRSSEFSYKPAQSYEVSVGSGRFMLPNGHHEALLEEHGDVPLETLALVPASVDTDKAFAALEGVAPHYKTALDYQCSECDAENQFWFDPMGWIVLHVEGLVREVHQLAKAYGWNEDEILALPRGRRQSYIRLIGGDE